MTEAASITLTPNQVANHNRCYRYCTVKNPPSCGNTMTVRILQAPVRELQFLLRKRCRLPVGVFDMRKAGFLLTGFTLTDGDRSCVCAQERIRLQSVVETVEIVGVVSYCEV